MLTARDPCPKTVAANGFYENETLQKLVESALLQKPDIFSIYQENKRRSSNSPVASAAKPGRAELSLDDFCTS